MRVVFFVSILAGLLYACGATTQNEFSGPRIGVWRAELDLTAPDDPHKILLPFLFEVSNDSAGAPVVTIMNGTERITVHEIAVNGDSVRIRMPLYDSEFHCALVGDSLLSGIWLNYLRGDGYIVPFSARAGLQPRFSDDHGPNVELTGEWKTRMYAGCCDSSMALGLFQQDGRILSGTFATETGDHRFLEGVVHGDSMWLSVFNGFQANLFAAEYRNDSLFGHSYWGKHGRDRWVANKDEHFTLRNADSLTFLKEGYDMVDLELHDLQGRPVSPQDSAHTGQVVIIQILGSWCPNCVDEALLFRDLHTKYHDRGLRIIGVAFERHPTEDRSIAALRRFVDHLDLAYPVCYAGAAKKEVISQKLPFLNHVMSFPTSITIDRTGKVRRIYTGFYGPGTGERYLAFKRDMERFLNELLNEPT